MTKVGIFYHNMRHLIKNKNNSHITVNNSPSPIPQVEEDKKQYTTRDVKRANRARHFHHITGQPVNKIQNAVDNNILKNVPILQEYFGMAEGIYEPGVPNFQGKTVCHKVQYVEPIVVPNPPKGILDSYNNVTLCCDLMHINRIGFLNTISRNIIFYNGYMTGEPK